MGDNQRNDRNGSPNFRLREGKGHQRECEDEDLIENFWILKDPIENLWILRSQDHPLHPRLLSELGIYNKNCYVGVPSHDFACVCNTDIAIHHPQTAAACKQSQNP